MPYKLKNIKHRRLRRNRMNRGPLHIKADYSKRFPPVRFGVGKNSPVERPFFNQRGAIFQKRPRLI